MTPTKNPAVTKMLPRMAGVRMLSPRCFGGTFINPGRGASEQSAIAAKVSMMTLIHSNWSTVNGGLNPRIGPSRAITRALTLMVSWNWMNRWMFS